MRALNANYDATEEDFSELFADFNDERFRRQQHIVKLWIRIAGSTTEPEWGSLEKARNAAVKALVTPGEES